MARERLAGETALGELDVRQPRQLVIIRRHLARFRNRRSKLVDECDDVASELRDEAAAAAAARGKLQGNRGHDTSPNRESMLYIGCVSVAEIRTYRIAARLRCTAQNRHSGPSMLRSIAAQRRIVQLRNERRLSRQDGQLSAMTTLPKCCADCRWRNAASVSSNENTLSMIGFICATAIARFSASNIWVEPTEIPCTLARLPRISIGLRSAAPDSTPIMLILPPMRTAPSDLAMVPAPPTSTTWSTPMPPVSSTAALSQSGVVL